MSKKIIEKLDRLEALANTLIEMGRSVKLLCHEVRQESGGAGPLPARKGRLSPEECMRISMGRTRKIKTQV
jgi:hypothetical protein